MKAGELLDRDEAIAEPLGGVDRFPDRGSVVPIGTKEAAPCDREQA
jgi:hypothetical protein